MASYQSAFRRGRVTIDPVLCLEDAVQKTQVNKVADMLWRERLMIKSNVSQTF